MNILPEWRQDEQNECSRCLLGFSARNGRGASGLCTVEQSVEKKKELYKLDHNTDLVAIKPNQFENWRSFDLMYLVSAWILIC